MKTTDDERFVQLLEKPDALMTDADWQELAQLERTLTIRDIDREMRRGFRELERTCALTKWLH